jgi:hypothetical protein
MAENRRSLGFEYIDEGFRKWVERGGGMPGGLPALAKLSA